LERSNHFPLKAANASVSVQKSAVGHGSQSIAHDTNAVVIFAQRVLFFSVKGMNGHIVTGLLHPASMT
jgi:hypothetical protein